MRRAFVIVLDACGVGALADAQDYGDAGTDTLGHLASSLGGLRLPTLQALGLGSAHPLRGIPRAAHPVLHGRLHALGAGKDSTAGHRELMGLVATRPAPTYPSGFPPEVIAVISAAAGGRGVICNRPDNGIEAIERFGAEHVRSGDLIVYTSQDSVLQIAAHVEAIDPAELYGICARVRAALPAAHAVGRVIARPFAGPEGAYARTDGRRDYATAPGPSYLDALARQRIPVHGVGKVGQLFAGRGFTEEHPGATNAAAIESTTALIDVLERGLVFTNLIETDQLYGHRHDMEGFAGALERIDRAVAAWLPMLRDQDMLVLTADHGCDPTSPRTDHTREHVPLLARFAGHRGRRHDGPMADVGASVLAWLTGRSDPALPGRSFL
ncbi:MAG TPA: phosphopentomutase [Solirubrobacteraceae bacterium]|nr:phosphopentomutase [Solirubrobacteraceae bacterium]